MMPGTAGRRSGTSRRSPWRGCIGCCRAAGAAAAADPTSEVDGQDLVTDSYAYDPAGQQASHTDAMGRTERYTYYNDGLLASSINQTATGDFINARYAYDAAKQPRPTSHQQRHHPHRLHPGRRRPGHRPDPRPRRPRPHAEASFDADGNLTGATTGGGSGQGVERVTTYTYDDAGRLTAESSSGDGTTRTTTLTVDQRGLTTRIIDPRGNIDGADPAAYSTDLTYNEVPAHPGHLPTGGQRIQRPTRGHHPTDDPAELQHLRRSHRHPGRQRQHHPRHPRRPRPHHPNDRTALHTTRRTDHQRDHTVRIRPDRPAHQAHRSQRRPDRVSVQRPGPSGPSHRPAAVRRIHPDLAVHLHPARRATHGHQPDRGTKPGHLRRPGLSRSPRPTLSALTPGSGSTPPTSTTTPLTTLPRPPHPQG